MGVSVFEQQLPTFWAHRTSSVERGLSVDQRGHDFTCCLHPVDGASFVCLDQFLSCCQLGPVHDRGLKNLVLEAKFFSKEEGWGRSLLSYELKIPPPQTNTSQKWWCIVCYAWIGGCPMGGALAGGCWWGSQGTAWWKECECSGTSIFSRAQNLL